VLVGDNIVFFQVLNPQRYLMNPDPAHRIQAGDVGIQRVRPLDNVHRGLVEMSGPPDSKAKLRADRDNDRNGSASAPAIYVAVPVTHRKRSRLIASFTISVDQLILSLNLPFLET